MLSLIQMNELANHLPSQISGGQKQRVAIARALIMKPQVLLLDEPLAALDLKLRQRMLLELDLIHDEVGITFIFITHDQDEAMSISDRIAIMNNGKIEQVGTPSEIYETPRNSFVAAFIGDTNFLEGELCSENTLPNTVNLFVEGLGRVICYHDKRMKHIQHVYLSIRPEKFHISKTKPDYRDRIHNVLKGVVEDIIYLGSHTKYWVRVGSIRITIVQQHHHFIAQEELIDWDDEVWISWDSNDGFMLGNYQKVDRELLESPSEKVEPK
jgi:spermidine/putrescine transport system ATP-binding protein